MASFYGRLRKDQTSIDSSIQIHQLSEDRKNADLATQASVIRANVIWANHL